MFSNKNALTRQTKLFLNKNIWLSILIVAIPSLVLAFMSGLFAFVDQIMMVKLIPQFHNPESLYGASTYNEYRSLFQSNNDLLDLSSISSIIRTSVAYTAPITVFINAVSLLLGQGTAINYSKYSGAKNSSMVEKTWTQGFWANLILSVLVTILICAFCQILISWEQGSGLNNSLSAIKDKHSDWFNAGDTKGWVITHCYTVYYTKIREYSYQFIYVLGAGSIFALYSQFISLLVIAEGKKWIVVYAAIFSNGLNILLDFLLIKYAHLTMISGAIAIVLGWVLNTLICFAYIYYLDRRRETNLHLASLKKINFTFKDYGYLFLLGLPSFLRNVSMAIAAVIQMSFIVSVAKGDASTYQSIYGAVNVVLNLFITALWGIVNGARIVCSYNYGAKNYKRVRWSYWIVIIISLIYGAIIFALVGYVLNGVLLSTFDVNDVYVGNLMLRINMLIIPMIAIAVGGMLLFQGTAKWFYACIAAIMNGVIFNIPISFIMQHLANHYGNAQLFLYTPLISSILAAITVLAWGAIYLRLHFQDKHAKLILGGHQ